MAYMRTKNCKSLYVELQLSVRLQTNVGLLRRIEIEGARDDNIIITGSDDAIESWLKPGSAKKISSNLVLRNQEN